MSRFVLGPILALLVALPLSAQPSERETRARVRKLIDAWADEKASARQLAADQLGSLGASAKAAIPALRAALADRERAVRSFAAAALLLIDQDEVGKALPVLQATFKDSKD